MDLRPATARGLGRLRLVRQVVLVVLVIEVAVLAVTGVWLMFNYRPEVSAWTDIRALHHGPGRALGVRGAHRFVGKPRAAHVARRVVGSSSPMRSSAVPGRRRVALLFLGPSLPVAQLAAGFTCYLLHWDQLALVAVTVGRNTKGYADAFGPGTKYVLVDGAEISKATLWRWFILHTAVISGVTVVLTPIALRLGPRSRSSP